MDEYEVLRVNHAHKWQTNCVNLLIGTALRPIGECTPLANGICAGRGGCFNRLCFISGVKTCRSSHNKSHLALNYVYTGTTMRNAKSRAEAGGSLLFYVNQLTICTNSMCEDIPQYFITVSNDTIKPRYIRVQLIGGVYSPNMFALACQRLIYSNVTIEHGQFVMPTGHYR